MTPEVIIASLLWSMVHMNAVEIQQRLDRLLVIGRVLYVAAHPDDENTQLLAYLTHARGARTAYLSLTRGDGGQNLIGSEQSPLMGVIRTHELMEARRIDGAEQLFTRAKDFGYSKRSDEALKVWGKDATLGDVVWAVRRFRPHLIITRFPETGSTHGHHLASAILAREAFSAAADESRFPQQLKQVQPWQAHRLVYNVPNRFMPKEARDDDLIVDIGGFDAVSGMSHGEIAAQSRSMHKSQGFGAARRFGPEPERFRHLSGERAKTDLLEGVDLDWSSLKGGAAVKTALRAARSGFRPDAPGAIADDLVKALRAVRDVEDEGVRSWAQEQLGALLVAVSGVLLEARSETAAVVPGGELKVKLLALRRGAVPIEWHDVQIGATKVEVASALEDNDPVKKELKIGVPKKAPFSTFPWLQKPPGPGRYAGDDPPEIPLPKPSLSARLSLTIAGAPLSVEVPVRHYSVDRVQGEQNREVEVLPAITVTPAAKAVLVPCPPTTGDEACKTKLRVSIRARKPGSVRVEAPKGYAVSPAKLDVKSDREIELEISAQPDAAPGTLRLIGETADGSSSWAERALKHNHLPARTVLLPAEVRLTTAQLRVPATVIGHVAGPGDEVADGLRRIGAKIEDIDDEELAHGELDRFGAILIGVRAFNTRDELRRHHQRLFDFAERGGTVLVQYTTKPRREPLGVPLLPYKMDIGRGRVTDETAAIELLKPDHPVFTTPNAIGEKDFAGWVQERGLYFGATWDDKTVTPLLSLADPKEPAEKGALLVADHGKGRVIYCGLSLFRQMPAGVPGAYRLITNLLARRDAAAIATADEPPPVLGRWRNLYAVVIGLLALLIAAFYMISRRYGK